MKPTLKVYLSLSKQFSNMRSQCLQKIDSFFKEYHVDVKTHLFEGGSYTYPSKEIGEDTDIVFTYAPNEGVRVGRGTADEIAWHRKNNKLVILITNKNYYTVSNPVHRRDNNWTDHAIVGIGSRIVSVDFSKPPTAVISKKELFTNFGLGIYPITVIGNSSEELLLLTI